MQAHRAGARRAADSKRAEGTRNRAERVMKAPPALVAIQGKRREKWRRWRRRRAAHSVWATYLRGTQGTHMATHSIELPSQPHKAMFLISRLCCKTDGGTLRKTTMEPMGCF